MKRLKLLVLTATALLAGCGGTDEPSASSSMPQTTFVMPEPEGEQAFDPAVELSNGRRQLQRQSEYLTVDYQLRLTQESLTNFLESVAILGAHPERQFLTDLCWSNGLPCAGDVRLYDWEKSGYGIVEPVLFANRTGAIISGHVWATKRGPAQRPLVVITGGSIQATEQMYWWAAQTLAKAGYVVLTTDPQNQGRSDTFGEGDDRFEGVLPQFQGNTFYDGTVDALDFMLSTPEKPYCPALARSGRSHCEKQTRRANVGLNTAFNPYWKLVDAQRIGLAGHSYGAAGVSYIGQQDSRVKAIVAWDNLCNPLGEPSPCQAGFQGPTPALHVPALGITNDYAFGPSPQPMAKSQASFELSKAGVETGMIAIRGGTHFEYSYLPLSLFSATHRGIDLAAWYTTAWFDKFLKNDATAEQRLLTTRWQQDATDAKLDPEGKGNMFSFITRSRLDIRLNSGARWICEDLRKGCAGLRDTDGVTGDYRFLDVTTSAGGTALKH